MTPGRIQVSSVDEVLEEMRCSSCRGRKIGKFAMPSSNDEANRRKRFVFRLS